MQFCFSGCIGKKQNMERKNHFINIISKYTNQIPIRSVFIKYNCLFDAENNISLSAIINQEINS